MFLDPAPSRPAKRSPSTSPTDDNNNNNNNNNNSTTTGFFSSQRPIQSPRDAQPLAERRYLRQVSGSRGNEQAPSPEPQPHTVRLVKRTPTPSSIRNPTGDGDASPPKPRENEENEPPRPPLSPASSPSMVLKPASASPAAAPRSGQDPAVSGFSSCANGAQDPPPVSRISLRSSTSTSLDLASPPVPWDRQSGSWGRYSSSSTLNHFQNFLHDHPKAENRLSEGSTLRDTPSPHELDPRGRLDDDKENKPPRRESALALETLFEDSPERPTVRPVADSSPSDNDNNESTGRQLRSQSSGSSLPRPHSSPSPVDTEGSRPNFTRWSSRRTHSTTSLPGPSDLRRASGSTPLSKRSEESIAQSEASYSPQESSPNFHPYYTDSSRPQSSHAPPPPSSPNLIPFYSDLSRPQSSRLPPASSPNVVPFYSDTSRPQTSHPTQASSPNLVPIYSDSSRPRSLSHPLQSSNSIESIDSRLHHPFLLDRSNTGRSVATTGSENTPQPSSSTDTLPQLEVPRRRLRHKPAQLSLDSAMTVKPDEVSSGNMANEEVDYMPFPREPFTSGLSTIASESERTTSQHLSHFSMGSGVLTGDDSSSMPLSSGPRRRGSAPVDSTASEFLRAGTQGNSAENAGDMTEYREESAKPQPLFRAGQTAVGPDRKYNGPLPPMPPIPKSRESNEDFDTVSELQSPYLREKRSGKSLRHRSSSTPSAGHSRRQSQVSNSDSDRWSQGSAVFPTWAKHFYGTGGTLMSASKVSLHHQQQQPQPDYFRHGRDNSALTDRSITSRLGTGYSEIEGSASSPTSSHFLPSIFRPRTRARANTEGNGHSQHRISKRPRPSADSYRPDSLAIFNDPLPQSRSGPPETLPSGQPAYGPLKDHSAPHHHQPTTTHPPPQDPNPNHPPLRRQYSKQKHWSTLTYPRPMTKESRLRSFSTPTATSPGTADPHLYPSRRHRQSSLSLWRAPSLAESLDNIFAHRGGRQTLCFALGFLCPFAWFVAAVLPLPHRPLSEEDVEKQLGRPGGGRGQSGQQMQQMTQAQGQDPAARSEEDVATAMLRHEAGDAEKRWREERVWLKARWWRTLNRIMCFVGVGVLAAVVALVVVAAT